MASTKLLLCTFLLLIGVTLGYVYDYDYISEDVQLEPCDSSKCQPPNCSCFSTRPPKGFGENEVPQFVMLTFDDAVTGLNMKTYRELHKNRINPGQGCPITATFFVSHEYNDYELTNELYRSGHEIAVHSISHESGTETWKHAEESRWRDEMVGMRKILGTFGKIPESTIVGQRAPFLQTAGNTTFRMLKNNGFLYDSSMPTRSYIDPPLWPYTLDYGYPQDCQIRPCPKSPFPGLWIVPMVQWKRTSTNKQGSTMTFHCSMADACTPYPETAADTVDYFMENFNRHYKTNKAPFPVFLHEAWLRDENRKRGYFQFIDKVLEKGDVFAVSVQEVVEYMKKPVTLDEYKKQSCFSKTKPQTTECKSAVNCEFKKRNRFMKSCIPCPRRYPWLENPLGQILA